MVITSFKLFTLFGGLGAFLISGYLGTYLFNDDQNQGFDHVWYKEINDPEEYLVDIDQEFKNIEGVEGYSCKYTKDSQTKYSDTCRLVRIDKGKIGEDVDIAYVKGLSRPLRSTEFGKGNFKNHSYKLIVDKGDISNIAFTNATSDADIELVNRGSNEQSFGKVKLTHKYENGYYKGKVDSLLVRYKGNTEIYKNGIDELKCALSSSGGSDGFKCDVYKTYLKRPGNISEFVLGVNVVGNFRLQKDEVVVFKSDGKTSGGSSSSSTPSLPLNTESYSSKQDLYLQLKLKGGSDEKLQFELLGLVSHSKGVHGTPFVVRAF